MNIWIINPFDPLPDERVRPGRYAYLSAYLSAAGHNVTWWTSNFMHMTKQHRCSGDLTREVNGNFRIRLLSTPGYKKNVGIGRLYNHHVYARELGVQSRRTQPRPEIILASLPPIDSARAAIAIGARLGAKVIVDVQDLWPEFFVVAFPKITRGLARRAMLPLLMRADWVYRHADAVIGVSEAYVRRGLAASREPKPGMVLHLGIDLKFFDESSASTCAGLPEDGDAFRVTYAGTVGKGSDIKTILEAASLLSADGRIRFFVAGDGPDYLYWKDWSGANGLSSVSFTGMLKYPELTALLKRSNLGLNAYCLGSLGCPDVALQTFPNKVFDYLAAALPVINSVPGEVQRVLAARDAGLTYRSGDSRGLAEAIGSLAARPDLVRRMSRNARRLVEELYDKNRTYPALAEFMCRVVAGKAMETA